MTDSNDQPVHNSTAPEQEPNVEEAMSRNRAVAKVISKPSGPGLLDLPPESDKPFPDLSILRTSKLIHREAFDVLCKENWFSDLFWNPPCPITQFPRILDTIQNIKAYMLLGKTSWGFEVPRTNEPILVKLGQSVGNHSIIRRNLFLELDIGRIDPHHLEWLVGALGKVSNFRTIQLKLYDQYGIPHNDFFGWCEHLKTALEPVLGHAEIFLIEDRSLNPIFLRFHPVDHQIYSREQDDGDCAYLDGICLG